MRDLATDLTLMTNTMMEYHSFPIVYIQGEKQMRLRAMAGKTIPKTENESSLTLIGRCFDFLIPAPQLKATPQVGDRVIRNKKQYELLDTGTGCWQMTSCRQFVRVHTKES